MKIVVCLEYTSFAPSLLASIRSVVAEMQQPDITVLHVVDETLFYGTFGFDETLFNTIKAEGAKLYELCEEYLGPVHYREEYGIPRVKIDETLPDLDYEMLIIGTHARKSLGQRLLGGLAEHLLHTSLVPVLIVPVQE